MAAVAEAREDDFAAVLARLDDLAGVSVSGRRHARTRLLGLQQACYQLGGLSAPPRPGRSRGGLPGTPPLSGSP